MKWILLASFFVTAYLLAFLLFNIRPDRMTVLSDRIKRFQINLLEDTSRTNPTSISGVGSASSKPGGPKSERPSAPVSAQ